MRNHPWPQIIPALRGMSIFGRLAWRQQRSSGFGPASTSEEVTAGVDGSHLTAIVTGATGGLGQETSRVLASRGVKVIIAARTLESGMKAKQSLMQDQRIPSSRLHVIEMDLSSLDSVLGFTQSFLSSHKHLNILVNNAGIISLSCQQSRDGIELNFATNHLGHFFLTNLLLDKMKVTAKEMGVKGRIINVSSTGHKFCYSSYFDINKLGDEHRFRPSFAYAHSKLANILHVKELSRRFQVEGCNLTANSLHPGLIYTGISRRSAAVSLTLSLLKYNRKNIPQFFHIDVCIRSDLSSWLDMILLRGAATICYLALHPNVEDVSGKYFADCNEATPSGLAEDEQLAKKVWDVSEELINRWKNRSS